MCTEQMINSSCAQLLYILLRQLDLDASCGGASPQKLEKRAPDELSPKPDPYELRAPQGCCLLFPTATQTEGNQSGQTLLSQNPTDIKLQRRLIVKHGF